MLNPMSPKEKKFIQDIVRVRGQELDFIRLGMEVEFSNDRGTIAGMNANGNLDVKFANTLKHGKHAHNCHPTWEMKYFDETGALIACYADGICQFSPNKPKVA
jgi:coproporphyrinogen III oxidase